MQKSFSKRAALFLVGLVSFAVTAWASWQQFPNPCEFRDDVVMQQPFTANGTVLLSGAVDMTSTVKVGGVAVTATAVELNAAADASVRLTTRANCTNNSPITLNVTNTVYILDAGGSAVGATNTITIVSPWPEGIRALLTVKWGATNAVNLADSTTLLALGADVALKATDTLEIFTTSPTTMVKVCESEN